MRHLVPLLLLLPPVLGGPPASAQAPAVPAPLVVTVENRTAAAEVEQGAPPREGAKVGDLVRHRLSFTNTTAMPVRGVRLNSWLQEGFQMVDGSVTASREDAVAEFSIDGGRTYSARPMEVLVEGGGTVRRPAAAETYSHVRWTVDGWVAPGATVTAQFDARLAALPRAGGRRVAGGGGAR